MNTIQEYIELLAARNELIRELQERIPGLENELSKREIELSNLKRLHFGQSSEKMKKPESLEPMPLFPEYDEATVEAMDNTLPPIAPSEIVDAIEEETKQCRKLSKSRNNNANAGLSGFRTTWKEKLSPYILTAMIQRKWKS